MQYSAVQYSTEQYSAVQYRTVQYSAATAVSDLIIEEIERSTYE